MDIMDEVDIIWGFVDDIEANPNMFYGVFLLSILLGSLYKNFILFFI